jgi:hypothetical protein
VSYPRALLFKYHAMKTWRSEILGPPFITLSYPYKQLNTISSVVQLVAYLYTNLDILSPAIRTCSSFNMRVQVSCSCKGKEQDKLLLFIF